MAAAAILSTYILFPFSLLMLAMPFVPIGLAFGLWAASWLAGIYFVFDAWRPTPPLGWRRWTFVIVLGLLAGVVVKSVFAGYYEQHSSMSPTIEAGDTVFPLRAAYWFSSPRRGDIVLFSSNFGPGPGITLEKRLIGLPGDTINWKDGVLSVNDVPYRYPGQEVDYAPAPDAHSEYSLADGRITVPANTIFVLGDNPARSFDSRYSGPIPLRDVRGKAFVVLWPIEHVKRIAN